MKKLKGNGLRMNGMLKSSIVVSLTLTLLGTPSVKAGNVLDLDAGMSLDELVLGTEEVMALAEYKKSCGVAKRNLATTKDALEECMEKPEMPAAWYQHPVGVILIGVLGIGTGFALGKAL